MLRAVPVPPASQRFVSQGQGAHAVVQVALLVVDTPARAVPGADLDRAADTVVAAARVDKAHAGETRESARAASSSRGSYHSECRPAPHPRLTLHNKGNAYLVLHLVLLR